MHRLLLAASLVLLAPPALADDPEEDAAEEEAEDEVRSQIREALESSPPASPSAEELFGPGQVPAPEPRGGMGIRGARSAASPDPEPAQPTRPASPDDAHAVLHHARVPRPDGFAEARSGDRLYRHSDHDAEIRVHLAPVGPEHARQVALQRWGLGDDWVQREVEHLGPSRRFVVLDKPSLPARTLYLHLMPLGDETLIVGGWAPLRELGVSLPVKRAVRDAMAVAR